MIHKHIKLTAMLFTVLLLFTGCAKSNSVKESDIVGKTYTYEKDGFGSEFTIQIKDDGTFQYYEGALSSYIGIGEWTLEDDILYLYDDVQSSIGRRNYFRVDGGDLVFIAENSTNFLHLEVSDGERFLGSLTEAK